MSKVCRNLARLVVAVAIFTVGGCEPGGTYGVSTGGSGTGWTVTLSGSESSGSWTMTDGTTTIEGTYSYNSSFDHWEWYESGGLGRSGSISKGTEGEWEYVCGNAEPPDPFDEEGKVTVSPE